MIGGAIDNMKTFEQFVNENYKPVQDETCGIEDNQVFRTGDIINYAEKNYEIRDVKVSDIIKFSSLSKENIDDMYLISVHAGGGIDDLIKKYGRKATVKNLNDDEKKRVIDLEIEKCMKTSLDYPVIVVTDKNGKYKGLLDGNHRLVKAEKLGKDTIKAYVLPYDELVKNLENIKMKTFEQFVNTANNKTIKDFSYVIEFFKNFYPDKNISNIPVYVISEDEWSDGKARQTENDRKGGIRIHENQIDKDEEIGWLIHEVGHVLDLRGERKPYLVSKEEFDGYPNEDDEQTPMWYQFHYLINKGLSEDQVIDLEKRDYSDCKGGNVLWNDYKDKFFRRYYQEIKKKI